MGPVLPTHQQSHLCVQKCRCERARNIPPKRKEKYQQFFEDGFLQLLVEFVEIKSIPTSNRGPRLGLGWVCEGHRRQAILQARSLWVMRRVHWIFISPSIEGK